MKTLITAAIFFAFTATANASWDDSPSAIESYANEYSTAKSVSMGSQPEIGSTSQGFQLGDSTTSDFWEKYGDITDRDSNPLD